MPYYGYEYFCGANVVIEIEGMPILETSGLRVSIGETKRPIYGYSSRHFDAVANGQVLAEGAILLNYVDHNYLFRAIEKGLNDSGQFRSTSPPPLVDVSSELRQQLMNEGNAQQLALQYFQDPEGNAAIAQAMKSVRYNPLATRSNEPPVPSPHDSFAGLDIRVTFGDREAYNFYGGLTHFVIQNVHFLGRGMQVGISEEVIGEEFPFFARDIVHLPDSRVMNFEDTTGESTVTIQN